jgi:hypothetical protein
MNSDSHDTDTQLLERDQLAPVTGEHRLRPPVTLDAEPADGVPVWEPEAGDFS